MLLTEWNTTEWSWRSEEPSDIRHGDVEFGVYPADFWCGFGLAYLYFASFLPFCNSNVYFDFFMGLQLRDYMRL